ncbi:unnamed protein product [Polarella glacialis]|uniref:Phospholipase/carboxylesterase/thioesterase domain-containing protein n=1 Tax=Polarella glacialis TaxID=89957 RepID=A0A813DJN3_POLGL|nr:unnamed protein product [Polarella glacialis]CAE8675126.1 unnamed protein product [Polarella glacialis]
MFGEPCPWSGPSATMALAGPGQPRAQLTRCCLMGRGISEPRAQRANLAAGGTPQPQLRRRPLLNRPVVSLLLSLGCAAAASSAEPKPRRAPAAVVLLHGSGDSGKGLQRYLRAVDGGQFLDRLQISGVETVFPDSGLRPYSLAGGQRMAIWFDRTGLPPSAPEDTASVEDSVSRLVCVLDQLKSDGIPASRIAVGGFSMGGGIALQLALRHPEKLGAVFALSSFLCDDAAVYRQLEAGGAAGAAGTSWPPTFMAHGQADDFIRIAWAEATARRLRGLGLPVQFAALPGVRHELVKEEIRMLGDWLWQTIGLEPGLEKADL